MSPASPPRSEERSDEGLAVLLAHHRQPRRDRGRHGGHESAISTSACCESSPSRSSSATSSATIRSAFTEHHFHIEGFELSNNPVLLDLYFAMQTKRIRVGQLGIVLPASNPIRVAEDIAMLDHMTGGRANARLRPRLPAPLGRRHGAADARHPRRAAQPARRDRQRQPRSPSRRTSASSRNAGPRRC